MVGGWLAYALLFFFLYPRIGPAVGSLGMLPVLFTAWLYGRWAGLLAGLLLLAFTPFMGIMLGDTNPIRLLNQSLPGYAMAVLTGFAFGWVRDTSNELRNQIAERKRVEDKLQRSLAQLEERNKELDAFAHTVAHDLKTSLTDIYVYADLLLEDHARMSAEDVRTSLETIAGSSQKMARVVDELLLLAQMRQIEVQIVPLDMDAVVTEALKRLQPTITTKHAQIGLPAAWPSANGHAPWVEEVWVNYISNALKHGGQPPQVVLGAEPEGPMMRFWVRDNGLGLSLEAQGRLFTEFTQLQQGNHAGHGLGLSIVRRIVEQLGGQVGVESTQSREDGHGSTFYFTLPASHQPPG
jgi:two-component system, sensor histidine kinase and response regulator